MQDMKAVSHAAADALLRASGAGAKKRLPHQVPPKGDFYGWAMIGGRGSGKTFSCAQYVIDHVNGPPCIKGPIPHWIGIIGPTLTDAATSCFSGPSGIRTLDPSSSLDAPDEVIRAIEQYMGDATNFPVSRLTRPAAQSAVTRLTQGVGGASVKWPNGSEAKLFGASSPDDVERQRSGGNRCIAAGTLVRTLRGQIAIEDVRVGDYVWTRNGVQPVSEVWDNGFREVRRYDHAGGSTWMTSDHEVWTADGWRQAATAVKQNAVVTTWHAPDTGQRIPLRGSTLQAASLKLDIVKVYDLTVAHDHEFFANNLLVSNCLVWLEEIAAFRYLDDTFDQMRFGLRQGPHPHWIASTTPKPRPLIRRIMKGEMQNVVMTHAITTDNPHLPMDIKEMLEESYGGRRIGRQELYAELVDEDENALWTRATIDENRIRFEDLPDLGRITVGVDPSGGMGEQGIIVNGSWVRSEIIDGKLKRVADGYTLADMTCHLSPDGWGKRAINAAIEWDANDVVIETNYGGSMALSVIRGAAEAMGISIPVKQVTASRGKRVRAEPVAALAQRGRLHHVGIFPELEDQLATWTEEAGYSPDRLDADVWGVTHLKLVGRPLASVGSFPSQMGSVSILPRSG